MTLRFIGTDGSMGLRAGVLYRVALRPWQAQGVMVTCPIRCPYASDEAFWRNWARP